MQIPRRSFREQLIINLKRNSLHYFIAFIIITNYYFIFNYVKLSLS